MNLRRVREIGAGEMGEGPIVYWMSRDQRAADNWALVFAHQLARERRRPLAVLFCLSHSFLDAAWRHYAFMFEGLKELQRSLERLGAPLFVRAGNPGNVVAQFVTECGAGALVCDFDPLRIKRQWTSAVRKRVRIPLFQVDAHNIAPCWIASTKQEFAARTFRPRIHSHLEEFLDDFPRLAKTGIPWPDTPPSIDWETLAKGVRVNRSVKPVQWIKPGERAAHAMLDRFLSERISRYHETSNNPACDCLSNLSPYIHFGHIAAQRVAKAVYENHAGGAGGKAFLEQIIVRKELSDNYCYYNEQYDRYEGFPEWARRTLEAHRRDRREFVYTYDEFEAARTHDPLWNAAQRQMTDIGKMHGYMRMYWAKKILEWTNDPAEALAIAVTLNDRFELDGRDPNGYVGCAWSVGGLHDRPWKERPVYGKVRYMSYKGSKSKFDVNAYLHRYAGN